MEITAGFVFLIIGIVGSLTCGIMLFVLEKNWKHQRIKLLEIIETEEQVR